MATQTRTARRTRQRAATTSGRFGRTARQPSSGSQGRWNVPTRGRKQPQKSGMSKALSAVGGALPTAAAAKGAKKATSGRKGRAGGVALISAAAGLAFKNRDKLKSAISERRGGKATDGTAGSTGGWPVGSTGPSPIPEPPVRTTPDPLAGTGIEPLLSEPGLGDRREPDRPPAAE